MGKLKKHIEIFFTIVQSPWLNRLNVRDIDLSWVHAKLSRVSLEIMSIINPEV